MLHLDVLSAGAILFLLSSLNIVMALDGGCSCASITSATEQQACLNKLVLLTQRGTGNTPCSLTAAVEQQACINKAVAVQLKTYKLASCLITSKTYQTCINTAICTQYRFALENFKYIGKASVDPNFLPDPLPMVKLNKSAVPIDPNQNTDKASYAYALRVVPSTQNLYQAWALAPIVSTPTGPGLSTKVSVDERIESKYTQGDVVNTTTRGRMNRKLSYIMGTDDRVQINPTTSYPWSAAVLIEFNIGSSGKGCSGSLIYSNAVLTAGHCVHKGSGGVWASSVKVSPGANGAARPFGTATVDHMTTYVGWASGGNFKYDMAVIKLSSSIGSTTGWLGMMSSSSFNSNLNAIGYPGDKPWPTQWYYFCPGVSDYNAADSVTKNSCDIYPGQSGSGNYLKNSAGSRYVRAITSYQSCTCSTAACTGTGCGAPYSNYFQQLTSTRFSDAKSWAGIP